jgi:hypothetical protein
MAAITIAIIIADGKVQEVRSRRSDPVEYVVIDKSEIEDPKVLQAVRENFLYPTQKLFITKTAELRTFDPNDLRPESNPFKIPLA